MNVAADRRREGESFLPHWLLLLFVAPMRLLLAALGVPVHGWEAWALAVAASLVGATLILISGVGVCAALSATRSRISSRGRARSLRSARGST